MADGRIPNCNFPTSISISFLAFPNKNKADANRTHEPYSRAGTTVAAAGYLFVERGDAPSCSIALHKVPLTQHAPRWHVLFYDGLRNERDHSTIENAKLPGRRKSRATLGEASARPA